MCRAHRVIVVSTILLWVATLGLVVANPPDESPLHVLMILLGTLAVVCVPYCLFPWLLKDVLRAQLKDLVGAELKDIAGAFLLGWESRGDQRPEPDPTEKPLQLVRGGVS